MNILKTILTLVAPMAFLRLYGGGGDGGAGEMRAEEEKRQAKVRAAIDAINYRFGSTNSIDRPAYEGAGGNWAETVAGAAANKAARDSQYADVSDAVQQTAMRDLDRQYGAASKKNTFGLARAGLMGGSVDAESGGDLQTLYGEGKLKATQAGMQAGSDLRMSDEKTRQNLVSLAQSGLDTGTAESMAAGQLSAAAESAKGMAGSASVGRLFDDMSQAYVVSQVGKARYPTAGQQQPSNYNTGVFSPSRYSGRVQQ